MHVLFRTKLTPNKISNTKIKMSHLKEKYTIQHKLNTYRDTHIFQMYYTLREEDNSNDASYVCVLYTCVRAAPDVHVQ